MTKQCLSRSVTFHPEVQAVNTLHITDYSRSEIRSSWYQTNDFRTFQNQARTEVPIKLSDLRISDDDSHFCLRGVLSRSEELAKRTIRRQAMDAVFDTQDLVWDNGFRFGEDEIAEAYRVHTSVPEVVAYRRGASDARAASSDPSSLRKLLTNHPQPVAQPVASSAA